MRTTAFLLLAWLAALLPGALTLLPGPLQFTVLDVGQGDATLFVTPHGRTVLVDAGPDASVVARLADTLPSGKTDIDLVVITHPHADHFQGLSLVLRQWKAGRVLLSGDVTSGAEWSTTLSETLSRTEVPLTIAAAGQRLVLDGLEIETLAPGSSRIGHLSSSPNDDSVVLLARYGSSTVLLTGDLEVKGERRLLASRTLPRTDVLKVGHHGSSTSTSQGLLDAVQPHHAAVSVGAYNLYRHPSTMTIDRLESAGAEVHRTDKEGTIRFTCTARCCEYVAVRLLRVFPHEDRCGTLH